MQNAEIRAALQALAEPKYREFSQMLTPGARDMLGVRLPALRKLARQLAKDDWRAYLDGALDDSHEEILLQAIVLGYAPASVDEILIRAAAFVSKIDNWAVCDTFAGGLKIARSQPEPVWEFTLPYLRSERTYDVRFSAVMLLNHYVDDKHVDWILNLLAGVHHPDYYAKMAVAWAVACCFTTYPERAIGLLESGRLDEFTHNKSISKICDSHVPDEAWKQRVRALRRRA